MLVLSRELGELVIIRGDLRGDGARTEITIEVVRLGSDKVRLGITAPNYVTINREEIQAIVDREAREEAKRLAETTTPPTV